MNTNSILLALLASIFILLFYLYAQKKRMKITVAEYEKKVKDLYAQSKILDQVHDAIVRTNVDGIINGWNKGAEKLFGYPANEVIGKHVYMLHRQADTDYLDNILLPKLFENGEIEKEIYLVKKSAEKFYAYLSISLAYDEQKTPIGMIGVSIDISERQRMDEVQKENEELLQRAQALAKMGHWKLDPLTQEVTGSNELFRIFCLSRNFSTLESFVDIVHQNDRDAVMQVIEKAINLGESWNNEYRILGCNGEEKHIHAVGKAIKNEAGEVIELIGTVQDISEGKKQQLLLEKNRMRFEVMFEAISDAVIFVDVDNRIKMVNKSFQTVFGYRKDEIQGLSFECLYQEFNDIQHTEKYFSADLQSKQLNYYCKDGSEFKGETIASPLVSPDGVMLGQLVIVRDVSERLLVDGVLRSLAESSVGLKFTDFMDDLLGRLCLLYQCEYAFIGQLQSDGEHVKTLSVRGHGQSLENFEYALAGTPCEDLILHDKNLVSERVAQLYPDDKILIEMEVESYFGARLVSADHSVIGLLAVMGCQTMKLDDWVEPVLGVFASRVALELERETMVNELQQHRQHLETMVQKRTQDLSLARDESERANLAKSNFLSHMSHELRTPLNAILGFAQILELDAGNFNETQRGDVQEILSAGRHLLKLINEVLDLAKIEAGKMDVYLQPVSVKETVQQCMSLMSQQAKLRQIEMIDMSSDYQQYVHADVTRFKQVLLNLISNAIKYNRHAGKIIIKTQCIEQQYLQISVTDTGNGLTEDQVKNVFTAFNRLNVNNNIEGAGIGLLICKQLVKLMGGEMGLETQQNKGCTFWLRLNLVNSEDAVCG